LAKPSRSSFVCQNCGASSPRWSGRCDACGEWNTLVEENEAPRIATGIAELDRVTGGGFVRGSALLVGGDPGIGKSTLLMQAAAALARRGHRVVYVSGEEAVAQVRLRARAARRPSAGASSRPRPASRTSSPRSPRATSRASSSSIRSRRCGPTWSTRRPAP
jgi:predicted ATP-dependent serine protease